MTLEIDRTIYLFNTKEIWFSDGPHDVAGCHAVTFRECKKKSDVEGFTREEHATLVIDLAQELATIWQKMGKKSCRYAIKRAVRDGIRVRLNQDYRQFYDLNRSFRQEKGVPIGFEKLDTMREYGTLFTAELEGDIIAGQLYLEDKDNIRWLLGASKRLEVDKEKAVLIGCGNRLMIWEAIKYAREKGIKEFDLGGYYTGGDQSDPRYTINIFKRSFGGELTTHYIYRKEYSVIYRLARRLYQLKQGSSG